LELFPQCVHILLEMELGITGGEEDGGQPRGCNLDGAEDAVIMARVARLKADLAGMLNRGDGDVVLVGRLQGLQLILSC